MVALLAWRGRHASNAGTLKDVRQKNTRGMPKWYDRLSNRSIVFQLPLKCSV
jgi:hypothetical protein